MNKLKAKNSEDWNEHRLKDVFEIKQGQYIKPSDFVDDGYDIYGANGVIGKVKKYMYENETVLISCRGANCGVVHFTKPKSWVNNNSIALIPKIENIEPKFVYYSSLNSGFKEFITGSAQPQIVGNVLGLKKILLPPLEVQKKIAEVLSKVDEDIERTAKVIKKTKTIKKGLIQDLFTKGIEHKKFKKTKLGMIPEEWQIISLQTMMEDGIIISHLDGNHGELYPKTTEFIDRGVLYLSANCIEDGKINFRKAKHLSLDRASKFVKGIAKDGDILFAHNATVGPVAILHTKEEYVILSTTLTYYRCNKDKLVPAYLLYFMESPLFSNQYKRVMAQSTRNQVPITIQRTFLHIFPSYKEQQKIAEILSKVDEEIDIYKGIKSKLEILKKGLMQDLLSDVEK